MVTFLWYCSSSSECCSDLCRQRKGTSSFLYANSCWRLTIICHRQKRLWFYFFLFFIYLFLFIFYLFIFFYFFLFIFFYLFFFIYFFYSNSQGECTQLKETISCSRQKQVHGNLVQLEIPFWNSIKQINVLQLRLSVKIEVFLFLLKTLYDL